jgi:methyl-accepting chemotaxis protein
VIGYSLHIPLNPLLGSLSPKTIFIMAKISHLEDLVEAALDQITDPNAITRQAESIRELIITMTEGFESQARSIESLQESISYNTDTVATALEIAAISQRTAAASQESAAAAMEHSASTSRNLDRLEYDISELKKMRGILIRDNQADRTRITRLKGQN